MNKIVKISMGEETILKSEMDFEIVLLERSFMFKK